MVLDAGKMYRPTDIAVDISTNSVYVVEQFNHRVSKWNYVDDSFIFTLDASWGSNGDGTTGKPGPIGDGGPTDNNFNRPTGIVLGGTNLLVTDTFHNRVKVITAATGAVTETFGVGGTAGKPDEEFYHPTGIDTNGTNFMIADENNHRCLSYDSSFDISEVSDQPDFPAKTLYTPRGVIFNSSINKFYVLDAQRGLANRYFDTEDFQDQFGTPGTTAVTELYFPSKGHGLTPNNETPFADTRNNAVKLVLGSTITNVSNSIDTPGTGDGQMNRPESVIAFTDAATDYILVCNTLNQRIEVFDETGVFQSNFGTPF